MIVEPDELLLLNARITRCKLCPRLSQYITQVGKMKVEIFCGSLSPYRRLITPE
jgi:hypothetical protein